MKMKNKPQRHKESNAFRVSVYSIYMVHLLVMF